MPAAQKSIVIEQGADFSLQVTWETPENFGVDLTGYTFAGQIRNTVDAPNPPAASFVFTVLDAANGVFKFGLTNAVTAELNLPVGAVYDVEATSPGGVKFRLLQGTVVFSKEVTR